MKRDVNFYKDTSIKDYTVGLLFVSPDHWLSLLHTETESTQNGCIIRYLVAHLQVQSEAQENSFLVQYNFI